MLREKKGLSREVWCGAGFVVCDDEGFAVSAVGVRVRGREKGERGVMISCIYLSEEGF